MTAATTPELAPRLPYWPALDGLRAIAVGLVLLAHAQVGLFGQGATFGVTMFFVISGFLITSLLIDEHDRTGRIDLLAFWRRRAYRLFPALIVVLLVATVFIILRERTDLFGPAIAASAFYVANFVAATGIDQGPLYHTWSLAAEEQFYVFWPLLLVVLLRFVPRWLARVTLGLAVAAAG